MSVISLVNKRVGYILNPYILFLSKSTNIDAIDSFTTELVEKKTMKWNLLRKTKSIIEPTESFNKPMVQYSARKIFKEIQNFRHNSLMVNLKLLSEAQIDHLVVNSIQSCGQGNQDDLLTILAQCTKFERLPTDGVCFQVLKFLSANGHCEQLTVFIALLRKTNNEMYTTNMELKHFEALSFWKSGNVDKALVLLKNAFELKQHSEDETVEFQEIVEKIILDTIGHKSEGVLVSITNVGTYFADKFQDFYMLTEIWTHCFISEWFSDQQVAMNLFRKNEELRGFVGKKTRFISFALLKKNNVDGVHRLVELLIKYDMKLECRNCLGLLFDYQYWRKDLRACSEIMQSCLTMSMPLSNIQNQQLLNLLIGKSGRLVVKPEIRPPTFKLKF